MIFTWCIWDLLETLKLWNPARHGPEGLALMLSASSPSDTEHRFNRCEIKDDYPFHYAEDLEDPEDPDLAPGIVEYHRANMADPFGRLEHREFLPPMYNNHHVKRVQGTPLSLAPQRNKRGRFISQYRSCKHLPIFPAVPMVKGLVMRRQFRRDIDVGALSFLFGRCFVALEWFRFERTISLDPNEQICFDQGKYETRTQALPVRRVSNEHGS